MVDRKHIVNKQVIEIRLNSKKDAHLIQDAFSKAYKNHIVPIIEKIADRFTNNGEIIKIDKLEVDVGGISIDKLHTDFPEIFEKNLEEMLIEKLHNEKLGNFATASEEFDYSERNAKTVSIKPEVENSIEILDHFLLTGTLPWWSSKNIQEIAEELLEKSPDSVKVLFLKLFTTQSIRKRFIYQFPEKTISKSLSILTPLAAPILVDIIEKITKVQSAYPFINLTQSVFKEKIWESTLTYTIENQIFLDITQTNEIELITQILSRLIAQTSDEHVSQKELYNFLSKISNSINLSKQQIQGISKLDSNIKTLLNKVNDSQVNGNLISVQSFKGSPSDEKTQIEIFTYFLQTGKIPNNESKYQDLSIQLIAEKLIENSPESVKLLLLNQLTDVTIRKRFIYQFSDEFIYKILRILMPTNSANKLIQTINKIQSFQLFNSNTESKFREDIWNSILIYIINNQQSINNDSTNSIESINQILIKQLIQIKNGNISLEEIQERIGVIQRPELFKEDIQKLPKPSNTLDRHNGEILNNEFNIQNNTNSNPKTSEEKIDAIKKNNLPQNSKPIEMEERENYAFSKTLHPQPEFESKHIDNAGLALLWPFLNIFFVRLNIVKDKKFVSTEAAQRAVHLIQYLVTEKEETPEHELLFNKLLCGIDIYEPIPLGFKITDNEKEECNALLQSVIDNWTVLKNTSINALRITFLQKEGILSKQPNGWKLTIERATVDILLDRLPWSISMIALPWCNEMIYVEW